MVIYDFRYKIALTHQKITDLQLVRREIVLKLAKDFGLKERVLPRR